MKAIERDKDQLILRLQEDVEHLSKIIHKLEGQLESQKLQFSTTESSKEDLKREFKSEVQ